MTENGLYTKVPTAYTERLMANRQIKKANALCLYCVVKGKYKYDEMQAFWDVSKGCIAKWVKEFDEEIAKMEASHFFYNEQKKAQNLHVEKQSEQKVNGLETKSEQTNADGIESGEGTSEQKVNGLETKSEHSNIKDKSISKGQNKFTPPTPEEIASFIKDRNLDVLVESFYLHYASNGWMVGKVKMKSWKHTVLKWHNTNQNRRIK